jgi:hypothetical protein
MQSHNRMSNIYGSRARTKIIFQLELLVSQLFLEDHTKGHLLRRIGYCPPCDYSRSRIPWASSSCLGLRRESPCSSSRCLFHPQSFSREVSRLKLLILFSFVEFFLGYRFLKKTWLRNQRLWRALPKKLRLQTNLFAKQFLEFVQILSTKTYAPQ